MYIFCNVSSFVRCYFFFERVSKKSWKIFIHIRALVEHDDLFFLKDIKVSRFKLVLLHSYYICRKS